MDPAAAVDMATADKNGIISRQDILFNMTLNENKYLLTAAFCRILSCRVQINDKNCLRTHTFRDFIS